MAHREKEQGSLVNEGAGEAASMARWLRGFGQEEPSKRILSMCLTMAARAANAELVKQLLEQGADPEMAAHPDHETDRAAIYCGDSDNPDEWTTAWSAAISVDSVECLEAMVGAGMNPVRPRLLIAGLVEQDAFLATEAANRGAAKCFAMAMGWAVEQAGLDLQNIVSRSWRSLVYSQAKAAEVEAMARVLQSAGGDINKVGMLGDSSQSLLESAAGGNVEMLRGLLAAGADLQAGFPLSEAAKSWREESAQCMQELLKAGCDPNEKPHGCAALLSAVECGSVQKVSMLIDAGASLDVVSPRGVGLLAMAAARGQSECVRFLLEKGLDPDEVVEGQPLAEWVDNYQGRNIPMVLGIIKAASEAKQLAVACPSANPKPSGPRL